MKLLCSREPIAPFNLDLHIIYVLKRPRWLSSSHAYSCIFLITIWSGESALSLPHSVWECGFLESWSSGSLWILLWLNVMLLHLYMVLIILIFHLSFRTLVLVMVSSVYNVLAFRVLKDRWLASGGEGTFGVWLIITSNRMGSCPHIFCIYLLLLWIEFLNCYLTLLVTTIS